MSFLAWPAANSIPGTARQRRLPRSRSLSSPSRITGVANSRNPLSTSYRGSRSRMPAATDSNSATACTSRLPWPHTITPIRLMLRLLLRAAARVAVPDDAQGSGGGGRPTELRVQAAVPRSFRRPGRRSSVSRELREPIAHRARGRAGDRASSGGRMAGGRIRSVRPALSVRPAVFGRGVLLPGSPRPANSARAGTDARAGTGPDAGAKPRTEREGHGGSPGPTPPSPPNPSRSAR